MDIRNNIRLLLLIGLSIASVSESQAIRLPTVQCTLTNKLDVYDWPGSAQDTFLQSTPNLFFICTSNNVITGDSVKAVWIADHTLGTWPANFTFAVKKKHVIKHVNDDETFEANLSVSKPPNGWPLGTYHVQLYIDGIEDKNYKFKIR